MKYLTTAVIGTWALLSVGCQDGSLGTPTKSGGTTGSGTGGQTAASGGATGSGGAGLSGTGGGAANTGGAIGTGGSSADSGGATGMGGNTSTGGAGTGGTTGTGGRTATGGAVGTGGMVGTGGAGTGGAVAAGGGTGKTGPFKIIVLSTALEFGHDSIPTCFKLLQDLGKATAPERAKIAGLAADTTWTVDQIASTPSAANYFSEVTAANLANYELFYSNNPTGPVFTNAPTGAAKKQIFVDYWTNGGSWAGQHSATDFEKANGGASWTWFHDNIDGGYFVDHDPAATPGTINWQADQMNHPIVKGLASPWSSSEEWYLMNRNIEAVPGFKILGKVTVTNSSKGTSPRPAVWVTENAKGGRSFYTIKGHSQSTYAEAGFRDLMLRGILWSVHRLPGGN